MGAPIDPLEQAIRLDRAGSQPLFAQILAALDGRIRAGELARGVRLPAVRDLAAALAVNRATVQRAYRELERRGLVEARVGSGTVVSAVATAAPMVPVPGSDGAAEVEPRSRLSRGMRDLAAAVTVSPAEKGVDGAIDFAMLLPDVSLFPKPKLDRAVAAALARGEEVLQYGAPAGFEPLRLLLAERLSELGITATANDVIIVNGVQQALDLIAKTFLDRGDVALVEAPTYANVLPLLRLYGVRPVAVPIDHEGIVPEALEAAIAKHRPKLLYTMPSFQNPTAVTMSLARRRQLIALTERHDVLVVEDGCEQDLHYGQAPPPPLAALSPSSHILHLGTFSKGLFPGLRLGHIVSRGGEHEHLVLAKRFSDYHADLLSQAVLTELLQRGDYDRHLGQLHRTYGERMQRTVLALDEALPEGVRFLRPHGGYKAWLELPPGVEASAVQREASRRGVQVLAGRPFYLDEALGESNLRLSISRTDPTRIEEGIGILGEVLTEALARSRQTNHEPRALAPLV